MRAVITLVIIAAAVIGAAWWIQHLTGAISLTVADYTVQAPVSVALVALLLFALALWLLFRLLHALFNLRHVVRRGGERGARRRGDAAVTAVLVALAARDGAAAKREAARARKLLGDTPQTLLLAAYAATMVNDAEGATEAFEKLAARKDAAFLGLRGLMSEAVAREDWARANELAKQAERANPGAAWLKTERTSLAVRTGDWQEALLLNKGAAPHAHLAAAAAESETDPAAALKLAKDAFRRDPGLAPAALAYARRLRDAGKEKDAQSVLRQAWARAPHPDLAELALAPAPDRMARLKAAQALVKDAPESAESHFLLGKLSLDAGLTGEALRHVEAAERGGLRQRRVYALMADIAEAAGSDEAHRAAQGEALRRAASAEPDPGWVCDTCGTTLAAWHPACPHCSSAGTVHWRTPRRPHVELLTG